MEPALATDPRTMLRMFFAALSLSLRRLVLTPGILVHVGFAAVPLLITLLIYIATVRFPEHVTIQKVHSIYEWFLRLLYLHFVVFFIANILGSGVMRQEREEQTLHYLFLQPVRRWMIVTAKFLAYVLVASVLCVGSLWTAYLALGVPHVGAGAVMRDLFMNGRAAILARESMVLVLALLAYGSFALLMGNFFKNATYTLVLLGWEAGLPYLPSTLKFWTISHYLQSLLPDRGVSDQRELFQLLGEFATTGHSLAVLLGLPCVFLAISIWFFRYRECLYGET